MSSTLGNYVELQDASNSSRTSTDIEDDVVVFDEIFTTHPPTVCKVSVIRELSWIFASATAILGTKELMCRHNYHFPATIALTSFVLGLIVYLIVFSTTSSSSMIYCTTSLGYGVKNTHWLHQLPNGEWRRMFGVSFIAAASIPMLFQGILHMPSLPAIVMLFPLITATESIIHFAVCSLLPSKQTRQKSPWWSLIAMSALSVHLYNEYRLMVPGLVWSITALISMGTARALISIELDRSSNTETRRQKFHGFIMMTIVLGIVISTVIAFNFEKSPGINLSYQTISLMLLNSASHIATAVTGVSLLAYSPRLSIAVEHVESASSREVLVSFCSSILLLIGITYSQPPTVVSNAQFLSYMLATFCVLQTVQDTEDDETKQSAEEFTSQNRIFGKKLNVASGKFTLLAFAGTGLVVYFLKSVSIPTLLPNNVTVLNPINSTSSTFDIVVSAYTEDPESIKQMLDSIKRTAYVSNVQTNIILYTKNQEANLTELKESTGADTVILLDNAGREGGTYLYHIVKNWDVLAEKTMFIQAHAHNMRELLPRINDYLVEETGMLSLGFSGVTCNCLSCEDRWGWKDDDKVIPSLYQEIYNQTCGPDTSILLSYKGQFIASASRIRRIKTSIYEKLLLAITTKEGWNPDGNTTTFENKVDAPRFGFTMERIWSLIMQCATDPRVAVRCPTLLSGMSIGGDVRDCQCLDT
ncbi:hypothetical protein GLAREA_12042 [Glarea lozoyensis ATCC 20868]|uniref:Uncharacterized protein n=1 Tax=Glarea lozoyensis (strain ATCC 20868 / MF5171) TaxID=1116229 RepID=S3D2B1_GLAL2|nr:uncharacterized protein GLAREA_12042 [Glarea lozoyensis ATCC 20868]EPE31960.1 hypothetical protein GLAREA_12042 [Glarea lozoyensis ATCC 20868]